MPHYYMIMLCHGILLPLKGCEDCEAKPATGGAAKKAPAKSTPTKKKCAECEGLGCIECEVYSSPTLILTCPLTTITILHCAACISSAFLSFFLQQNDEDGGGGGGGDEGWGDDGDGDGWGDEGGSKKKDNKKDGKVIIDLVE
jgi:hypothetical protein